MRAAVLTILGFSFAAGVAYAGDNNTVHIRQESPIGSSNGNTLMLDQSKASNSAVLGPSQGLLDSLAGVQSGTWYFAEGNWLYKGEYDPESQDPNFDSKGITLSSAKAGDNHALQRGEGNSATLKLEGYGGELQLLQDTGQSMAEPRNPASVVNTASATLIGSSLGTIIQQGVENNATLTLTDATGLISQRGERLSATLTVGSGGSGQIVQVGDGNSAELLVNSGASATYTQVGNNLEAIAPTAVEVFATNPGSITITQTGF